MTGVLCHLDSSTDTTSHDDGSGVLCHLDALTVTLD